MTPHDPVFARAPRVLRRFDDCQPTADGALLVGGAA
jgi:hypothetical protein